MRTHTLVRTTPKRLAGGSVVVALSSIPLPGAGWRSASLEWRMLVTGDRQGGESTFVFSHLQENRGVPDRTFAFQIPRGVDVISDPAQAPRP